MVEVSGQTTADPAPKPRAIPRWESDCNERIAATFRPVARRLSELATRDANEGDTRLVVTSLLTETLGYDLDDLITEYAVVKGQFADYGIRVDRQLVAFIVGR